MLSATAAPACLPHVRRRAAFTSPTQSRTVSHAVLRGPGSGHEAARERRPRVGVRERGDGRRHAESGAESRPRATAARQGQRRAAPSSVGCDAAAAPSSHSACAHAPAPATSSPERRRGLLGHGRGWYEAIHVSCGAACRSAYKQAQASCGPQRELEMREACGGQPALRAGKEIVSVRRLSMLRPRVGCPRRRAVSGGAQHAAVLVAAPSGRRRRRLASHSPAQASGRRRASQAQQAACRCHPPVWLALLGFWRHRATLRATKAPCPVPALSLPVSAAMAGGFTTDGRRCAAELVSK
ncbi:hypothetical protein FA09DRAFT_80634 [Tilletiopsis washingtonensis]|jgi:hypothetical protein|uniref:Uncharacterized protein n=1 Tax=Tilletiopsis washingtonensis TaxID=58919 RepID=A0A316Z6S0_9BASI|nr:hypothetical protein FA09DRAFT_80634 [Tilletiopsis washingtonensis]PWN96642.1 hypothetical protein FA09DRAFT_80634 [Tilletiopsis washingtonensis]